MSQKICYTVAERYRAVRKNLDELGYKQALSLDSLPLIELLLVDLVQAKKKLEEYKAIADDNEQVCSELQHVVEPYKCENAKLVQECNQLHLELIEAKENNHKQTLEFKKRIRKLESEVNDLQLSNAKNLERIKILESESSKKSKKILELQGKCCKPTISNANLATKKRPSYPLRRPVIEAEPLPRIKSSSSSGFSSKNVEPYVVNFVSMADHRINCLNNEILKLKEELFISNENVESLKSQLSAEKKEMSRLRTMLEGGRPCSSINKDHMCGKVDNCRCSDAKDTNLFIQDQLREALNKQHETAVQAMQLAERNKELEKELKEIDRLAESACHSSHKHSNKRVCKIQEKLDSAMTQVRCLENELTIQKREAQELRADLESCRLEKSCIQRLLESTMDEQKKMTDKINLLTSVVSKSKEPCNRDTCAESTCLGKMIHEKDVIISSLQHHIERLETERDKYKRELKAKEAKEDCRKNQEKENENIWSQICDLQNQLKEKENAISKLLREKKDIFEEKCRLESKLDCLQSHKKRSLSPCKHTCTSRHNDPCSHPECNDPSCKIIIERLKREKDCLNADVDKLIAERDALRERLKGARRETVKGLEDQLQDVKDELQRTKDELCEQRSQYFHLRSLHDQMDQTLSEVQGQLSRAENELALEIERNKLIERQKVQLDNQMKELKQEVNTYKSKMSQLDREKDQLVLLLDEKTERIAALEREVNFKEHQAGTIGHQVQDLQHAKQLAIDQCTDLESQLRSKQVEVENLMRQLSVANCERDNAIQVNRQMHDDLASVSYEVRNLTKELEASKAESCDLKQKLQYYVTEVKRVEDLLYQKETERCNMLRQFKDLSTEAGALENNNQSLESEATEARCALNSAREQIMDLERNAAEKECLLGDMQDKINELCQSVSNLEMQLKIQIEQKREIEEDLRATRDMCARLEQNKDCIRNKLDDVTGLKCQYEAQLSNYRAELSMIQSQINKDHMTIDHLEKMLEQSRQEAMDAKIANQEFECEIAKLKTKIDDLQDKLCSKTEEMRQYQTQAAEYSGQIAQLRRQITNAKFDLAKKGEEIESTNKCSNCNCTISPVKSKNSSDHASYCPLHNGFNNSANHSSDR